MSDNSRPTSVKVKKALLYIHSHVFLHAVQMDAFTVCRGFTYTSKSTVKSTDASSKVVLIYFFFNFGTRWG